MGEACLGRRQIAGVVGRWVWSHRGHVHGGQVALPGYGAIVSLSRRQAVRARLLPRRGRVRVSALRQSRDRDGGRDRAAGAVCVAAGGGGDRACGDGAGGDDRSERRRTLRERGHDGPADDSATCASICSELPGSCLEHGSPSTPLARRKGKDGRARGPPRGKLMAVGP